MFPPGRAAADVAATAYPLPPLTADGSWHGIEVASDGKVYLGLCTHSSTNSAQLLRFDPRTKQFDVLADLGDVTATPVDRFTPQGKIHTPFFEHDGRLYFATHLAIDPTDERPYPGGKLIAFELATGTFTVLTNAPINEGIITLAADFPRQKLYGLTHPSGRLLVHDLESRSLRVLETMTNATGYVCRYLAVDPRDGHVYGARPGGELFVYRPGTEQVETLPLNLLWRTIRFDKTRGEFVAIDTATATLHRFVPCEQTISPIARLSASERHGESASPGAAKLAFVISPERVIHHLTPARDGLHLVTYDLARDKFVDHGPVTVSDGTVTDSDSLALAPNGMLYALVTVEGQGKRLVEIRIVPVP